VCLTRTELPRVDLHLITSSDTPSESRDSQAGI
jgi:hypothetical protein